MKKILLINFLLLLGCLAYSQCGNLFINGVIDGPLPGGLPKGVQVCASGAIADLSIYGLGAANNGGGTDGQEFTFPAEMANAGDCFWVASEATQFAVWFGFAPCFTDGDMGINGDDAIELFCSGSVEDLFGDPDTDGTGQCWDHLDGWAVNTTGAPNNGAFDCADWTFSGTNALDGESDNATADTPYPNTDQDCPMPLPIALIDFIAASKDEAVTLAWTTASEENNDFFSIEHSTDGINYTEIDYVKGAGTSYSENNYEYTHRNPAKGSNYYRLMQVDYNRNTTYSPVEVVEFTGKDIFTIRPTLAKGEVILSFDEDLSRNATVEVFNLVGKRVLTQQIAGNESNFTFDVSNFQNGHYLVRMQAAGQVQSARFVKF